MAEKKLLEGKKSRSMKTEELRQRILQESIKLFTEQGYEKTTTRQIIQKVGILNGSLYNIYKSKEDIFSDIILLSIAEAMQNVPDGLRENEGSIDKLAYLLCIEIYLSKRSKRLAELLCIANGNWKISNRLDGHIAQWARTINACSPRPIDVDDPDLRLKACSGVAYVMVEKLINDSDGFDERSAMVIITEAVYSLFHIRDADPEATVDRFLQSFKTEELVVYGVKIL